MIYHVIFKVISLQIYAFCNVYSKRKTNVNENVKCVQWKHWESDHKYITSLMGVPDTFPIGYNIVF